MYQEIAVLDWILSLANLSQRALLLTGIAGGCLLLWMLLMSLGVRQLYVYVIPALGVLGTLVIRHFSLPEQAFVSIRYAQNLTQGLGPTERLEGYISPLWLWLLSLADRMDMDPLYASYFLTIAFIILMFAFTVYMVQHHEYRDQFLVVGIVVMLFAVSQTVVDHVAQARGDVVMFTAILSVAFLIDRHKQFMVETPSKLVAILFGLAYMARPEAALVFAGMTIYYFWDPLRVDVKLVQQGRKAVAVPGAPAPLPTPRLAASTESPPPPTDEPDPLLFPGMAVAEGSLAPVAPGVDPFAAALGAPPAGPIIDVDPFSSALAGPEAPAPPAAPRPTPPTPPAATEREAEKLEGERWEGEKREGKKKPRKGDKAAAGGKVQQHTGADWLAIFFWVIAFALVVGPFEYWRHKTYGSFALQGLAFTSVSLESVRNAFWYTMDLLADPSTAFLATLAIAGYALTVSEGQTWKYVAVVVPWLLYLLYNQGRGLPPGLLLPLLPPALALAAKALDAIMSEIDSRPRSALLGALLVLPVLLYNYKHTGTRPLEEQARFAHLGMYLRRVAPRGVAVASDAAGAIPYFSELQFVDMYGMDGDSSRPSLNASGQPAHVIYNAEYITALRPAYIFPAPVMAPQTRYPPLDCNGCLELREALRRTLESPNGRRLGLSDEFWKLYSWEVEPAVFMGGRRGELAVGYFRLRSMPRLVEQKVPEAEAAPAAETTPVDAPPAAAGMSGPARQPRPARPPAPGADGTGPGGA